MKADCHTAISSFAENIGWLLRYEEPLNEGKKSQCLLFHGLKALSDDLALIANAVPFTR